MLDWTEATLARVERTVFFQRFRLGEAVQYFDESFLAEFDPELRPQFGVWSTPPEVVKYMVARVDRALQENFALPDSHRTAPLVGARQAVAFMRAEPARRLRARARRPRRSSFPRRQTRRRPGAAPDRVERSRAALLRRASGHPRLGETLPPRVGAGLFENVRAQVRAAFIASHPARNFAAIEPPLIPDGDHAPCYELAAQLGTTEGAARLLIFRLPRKFRELLDEEIARTVADPGEIPGELAWLRAALAER